MTEEEAEEKQYAEDQLMSMVPIALRRKAKSGVSQRASSASKPLVSVPGPTRFARAADPPGPTKPKDNKYEKFMTEMAELGAFQP